MSSKVEVLCPNGHRISVKTTPNTKILQVVLVIMVSSMNHSN